MARIAARGLQPLQGTRRAFLVTERVQLANGRWAEPGEILPRRQAENVRLAERGLPVWSQLQGTTRQRARFVETQRDVGQTGYTYQQWRRDQRTPQYQRFADQYRDWTGFPAGPQTADPASEFNVLFGLSKRDGFQGDPQSAFARFLVLIGYREPTDDWNPGESPRAGEAAAA